MEGCTLRSLFSFLSSSDLETCLIDIYISLRIKILVPAATGSTTFDAGLPLEPPNAIPTLALLSVRCYRVFSSDTSALNIMSNGA